MTPSRHGLGKLIVGQLAALVSGEIILLRFTSVKIKQIASLCKRLLLGQHLAYRYYFFPRENFITLVLRERTSLRLYRALE